MKILKSLDELNHFLRDVDAEIGCLADTGFLYAQAFDDDRLHNVANDLSDVLSENEIAVFANVVSRMEFIDLIFRKLVTRGAIKVCDDVSPKTTHKNLWNSLKYIRDKNTSAKNDGYSYKVNEAQIKKLRAELEQPLSPLSWKTFCGTYLDQTLFNEWTVVEQEMGLNFIEIMEGAITDEFNESLSWSDMVKVMGKHGLRGPDAMIANLFAKSKFPLLITTDSDFEKCISDPIDGIAKKAIFLL